MSNEETFARYQSAAKVLVGKYLPKLLGQPDAVLANRDRFQELVVEPAWAELPDDCRQLGRDALGWDALFAELFPQTYQSEGGAVGLQSGANAAINTVFRAAMAKAQQRQTAAPQAATPALASDQPPSAPPLGIDLGTTYSALAYVDPSGRPISIRNADGDLLTPSVVLFDEGGVVVGKEAVASVVFEPESVAICAKREMGQKVFSKPINGEMLPPQVISSIILRSLKADASRRFDDPVKQAVITVPAYFDEKRRQATVDAGRMAGLDVLDIINEPTAAAVAFGHQFGFLDANLSTAGGEVMRVLVYDLGGGTFDVTVLEIRGNSFKAVATDGDVMLGGKDWDQALVDLAAERFEDEHDVDPRDDPAVKVEMEAAAENAKRSLTERSKASMYINYQGSRMKIDVTREDFEEETIALLSRTKQTTEMALREAGLTWQDISRVLLIGGSTRMPMVSDMLKEISDRPVDQSMSPDEAVAHGAALYADMLVRREQQSSEPARFDLTDVNSHSLGIVGVDGKTKRKVNHILIPKNTLLPHVVEQTFSTAKPGQQSVKVEVLEGENPVPEYCTQVGVSLIRDLPPDLPAKTPVHVRYEMQKSGRLQVTARVNNMEAKTTFARDNSLDAEELKSWSAFVGQKTGNLAGS